MADAADWPSPTTEDEARDIRVDQVHRPLLEHLQQFGAAPYLFVGAGLSRRYSGLDGWEALLRRFARETDKEYEYYRASAGNDFPKMGGLIAESFHEVWWSSDKYRESRELFKEESRDKSSAMKIEISRLQSLSSLTDEQLYLDEIDALREATIQGAITTNYDNLLEEIFPSFVPFVGQDGLLFQDSQGLGEIYKIHGSVTEPNSIILTTDDYARFKDRQTYLAAKLLTIFVEAPVIFLGYSMSDQNVADILESIGRGLTQQNIDKLRDRLIFVEWDRDSEDSRDLQELEMHTLQLEGAAVPARRIRAKSFLHIFEALRSLERRYPTRLLRQLRKSVYELVQSEEPTSTLQVVNFDAEADLDQVRFVVGVGSTPEQAFGGPLSDLGYGGLSRRDLVMDVLEDKALDASKVVRETLPRVATGNAFAPVYKYFSRAGLLDDGGHLPVGALTSPATERNVSNWPEKLLPSPYYVSRVKGNDWQSVADIVRAKPNDFPAFVTALPLAKIDVDELRRALLSRPDLFDGPSTNVTSGFGKAACLVDFMTYGPGAHSTSDGKAED